MILSFIWQKTIQFCRDCCLEWEVFLNEKNASSSNQTDVRYIQFHSRRKKDILGVRGENEAFLFIQAIRYSPQIIDWVSQYCFKKFWAKPDSPHLFWPKMFQLRRYNILEKNIRLPSSEFDIVAFDKQQKCFVFFEIKTRQTLNFGQPFEAVDERRQKKMIKGAKEYLCYKRCQNANIRLDIISILWENLDESPKIEHLENAFNPLIVPGFYPSPYYRSKKTK